MVLCQKTQDTQGSHHQSLETRIQETVEEQMEEQKNLPAAFQPTLDKIIRERVERPGEHMADRHGERMVVRLVAPPVMEISSGRYRNCVIGRDYI
mmetsp:Transcript_49707/g.108003  ORF Transcript_49707/g.108003 Transcript_49707/m.108003 type:complete len:95 (-) Transcript_49707:7-291(-)